MTDTEYALPQISRRRLLKYGAAFGGFPAMAGAGASTNAMTEQLKLLTPEERLRTHVKLIGSLSREDIYISMRGELWGVLPGRAPVPVCGFQGIARANWVPQTDGSFLQRSFDVGFFSDLETGDPIDQTNNPFTGEVIRPFHYKYGGNERRHSRRDHEETDKGSWACIGDQVSFSEVRQGEFPSPFPAAEWPRESSGETYYASSETTYLTTAEQLIDDGIRRAKYTFFWTAFLSWEPWLLMDGVPGFVMWRGIGAKLDSKDDVPQQVRDYVANKQPNYFDDAPPWEGQASTYASYRKKRKPAPRR